MRIRPTISVRPPCLGRLLFRMSLAPRISMVTRREHSEVRIRNVKASRGFRALALVCSLCVLSCRGAEQRPQYNVLFIIGDDLRPELGAYGNRIIKTPNIDKLASWGVRFDAAYAQFPLCNPSRTSMLTGRYPTQTGVLDNDTWFGAAHPDFVTLPKYFKQQGYVTLRMGKIFHAGLLDRGGWTTPRRGRSAASLNDLRSQQALTAQTPGKSPPMGTLRPSLAARNALLKCGENDGTRGET